MQLSEQQLDCLADCFGHLIFLARARRQQDQAAGTPPPTPAQPQSAPLVAFPCPDCGQEHSHYRNVGRCQYFVCEPCKVAWLGGSNIFSSWQVEPVEKWEENADELKQYRLIEVMP